MESITANVACGGQFDVLSCLYSLVDEEDESVLESAFSSCLQVIGCSPEEAVDGSRWVFQSAGECAVDKESVLSELRKRESAALIDTDFNDGADIVEAIITAADALQPTPPAAVVAKTTAQTLATITSAAFMQYKQMELRQAAPTTAPLVCLSTSESPVSWCATNTVDNGVNTVCQTTQSAIIACASGLICATLASGDTSCMVRQNYMTTSGLAVAIFFGVVIVIGFAAMITLCIGARRHNKAIATGISPTMAGMPSEDALPLMTGGHANTGPPQARNVSDNPFAEGSYGSGGIGAGGRSTQRRPTPTPQLPRLHAGLMSAPEEEEDVGSRLGGR